MVVVAPFCDYRKNLHCVLKMGQFLWHTNGVSINFFLIKKKINKKQYLKKKKKTILSGTSLAVQWLRLHLVKEWKVPHAAKPIASLQAANSKGHCSLSHSGLASQQPDSCPFPPLAFHDITRSGFSRVTHHACSVSFAGFSTSLWMLEGPRLCVGPSYHLYWYFIPFGVYSILSH